jgi:hypothetical protein
MVRGMPADGVWRHAKATGKGVMGDAMRKAYFERVSVLAGANRTLRATLAT